MLACCVYCRDTISVHVLSILLASSWLDERQEDDIPEVGQDMKPKVRLYAGIHSFIA
jgi:hypothetical protein